MMFEKNEKLYVPCRFCGYPVEIADYSEADTEDYHTWDGRCADDPKFYMTKSEKEAMK